MRTFTMEKNIDKIRTIGRVWTDRDGMPCFDWSLSGIEFRYTGRVLTGWFRAEYATQTYYVPESGAVQSWPIWPRIAVFLDDEEVPHRIFTVDRPDKDEIIFSSSKKEDHIIRIVKLTEAMKSSVSVGSFFGDGELLQSTAKKKPLIEFIGDSLTCGYGNMAPASTGYFLTEHEDPTKSYAYLAAKALEMEPVITGFSGICGTKIPYEKPLCTLDIYPYTNVIRELCDQLDMDKVSLPEGWDGVQMVPEETGQASRLDALYADGACRKEDVSPEEWDFKHHQPKIIVINLGSNDAAGIAMAKDRARADAQFEEEYYALLSMVREKNGLYAPIICALGDATYYPYDAICRAAERFVKETGDTKIHTLKLRGHVRDDMRGAADHPGIFAHKDMAEQLVSFIRTIPLP